MEMDRFDNLEDLNRALRAMEAAGRKIVDVKIFSYTTLTKDGFPQQMPLFYVLHDKGIIKL